MQNTLPDLDTLLAGATLSFNKPLTWTSFDVANKVKFILAKAANTRKIRIGHAGTLDPLASGLLVLCVGKHTKNIETIQSAAKTYEAVIKFGATTASYDRETPETDLHDASHLTEEAIRALLPAFLGEIDQLPPVYSALKVDGKRAYDMARAGKEVVLNSRKVQIYGLEVLSWENPVLTLRVHCGKGTYIRSLAHDLGQAAGTGAYLLGLVRTRIGDFSVENAWEIADFQQAIDARAITPLAE